MLSQIDLYASLQDLSVPGLLLRHARSRPAALALSAPRHDGGRERLSYSQLAQRMQSMAGALARLGLRPGERLALYLSNDAMREAVLTALGCYRLGAAVVPFNVRAGRPETQDGLALIAPTHIVTLAAHAEWLARLCPAAALLVLDAPRDGQTAWPDPDLPASADSTDAQTDLPPLPDAEQPSVLLFTSGTTGSPKAVVHSHRSQLYCGYAIAAAVGLNADDLYQGAWPIYTSSVLNLACMGAWVAGAAVVLESASPDNGQRLRLIESEATTVYHGVPSVLNFMFKEYARGGYRLDGLRRLAYGGAAMPAELVWRMRDQLPGADQVHIWGMTETGPAGTYLPPWLAEHKPGSIGAAQPGCQLKIVDEDGQPVAPGTPGELLFRGRSAALGYFRNDDATRQTFEQGWVRTGDVVRADEDGDLTFLDRKKDVINRGGTKIASALVEDVLHRYAGVIEAAVVAVPHHELGEDLAACLVLQQEPIDLDALRAHCRAALADYQVPRRWYALDQLPKNPMGKVLKRALRQTLCAPDADPAPRRLA